MNCSELLDKFDICRNIELRIRKTIRLFYVFHNFHRKHNVLFVTSEDKVYSFGFNRYGVCGFGHDNEVLAPEEVIELREKNVVKFVNGENFVLALTSDRRMFGWGTNGDGQLAQKNLNIPGYYKPIEITFFIDRELVQVKCGLAHCLALTPEGKLYAWGDNLSGQVGIGQQRFCSVNVIRPVINFSRHRVKSIFCAKNVSFALMENGQVYSWGCNVTYMCGHKCQKFIYVPRLVTNLNDVVDICSSFTNTYAVTRDGKLFICGSINGKFQKEFTEILTFGMKVKNLLAFGSNFSNMESLTLTERGIYKITAHHMTRTEFTSFSDYCSEVHQITPEPIEIKVENRVASLMARSFNNCNFYDLKIKLKKRFNDNYEFIYVHKWFITESVEYFRGMFANNWKESQTDEIEINGYSYETYYQFLRWLYMDFIDATDIEVLLEMLYLSEEYLINEFKMECVDQIKKIEITRENCGLLYTFAVEVQAKELEELCLDTIRNSIKDIMHSECKDEPSNNSQKRWWQKILFRN